MLKFDFGNLALGVLFFTLGHIGAFYQLNGQFIWKWFEKNEITVAAGGFVLSFFYIWGTKYTVAAMDGLMWPARFIGFGIGMLLYAIFVNHYFAEGMNTKTLVSLFLCLMLISIQVFWKVN